MTHLASPARLTRPLASPARSPDEDLAPRAQHPLARSDDLALAPSTWSLPARRLIEVLLSR